MENKKERRKEKQICFARRKWDISRAFQDDHTPSEKKKIQNACPTHRITSLGRTKHYLLLLRTTCSSINTAFTTLHNFSTFHRVHQKFNTYYQPSRISSRLYINPHTHIYIHIYIYIYIHTYKHKCMCSILRLKKKSRHWQQVYDNVHSIVHLNFPLFKSFT